MSAVKDPRIDFWMVKPKAGWPVGDYRVDLLVNGKKATEIRFKVK